MGRLMVPLLPAFGKFTIHHAGSGRVVASPAIHMAQMGNALMLALLLRAQRRRARLPSLPFTEL